MAMLSLLTACSAEAEGEGYEAVEEASELGFVEKSKAESDALD